LQPDECWMLEGRLPTVTLRMNRSSKNAERIAIRLAKHPKVERVCILRCSPIPSKLKSRVNSAIRRRHAFHRTARRQESRVRISPQLAHRAQRSFTGRSGNAWCAIRKRPRIPAFTEEEFAAAGVTDGLVRISIGIEDWRDLMADFEQALDLV